MYRTVVSPENRLIQRALAPGFKELGFRKDGATWRRSSPEVIVVFNIQGSQWGRQFYLNLGAYLRQLGAETAPTEYRCHVRVRLSELLPEPTMLGKVLDFDGDIPASVRFTHLVDAVGQFAMPWLQAMSACDTARIYLGDRGALARATFFTREARELLGVWCGVEDGAPACDRPEAGDRG